MTSLRLALHVILASVWVGGQLVLVGLLPTVRTLGEDAPRAVARAFGRLAWPALGLTVLTGLWNVMTIPVADLPHPWVELHVLAVLVSAGGAFAHAQANRFAGSGAVSGEPGPARMRRVMLAAGGAVSSLGAVAAMYLGIVVSGALT